MRSLSLLALALLVASVPALGGELPYSRDARAAKIAKSLVAKSLAAKSEVADPLPLP